MLTETTSKFIDAHALGATKSKALVEFLAHTSLGTFMFCLIAVPAFVIDRSVHYFHAMGLDPVLPALLETVEFMLLAVDLLLFAMYLLHAASRYSRVWAQAARDGDE